MIRFALAFAALLTACGGAPKTPEPIVPVEPEPPALPGPKTAKGFALGHFASTTHLLVGADLASLRASSLYERVAPMAMGEVEGQLEKFRQQCNIDFVTAVDSLLLGTALEDNPTVVVAMQSSLEQASLVDCVTAVYGEAVAVAQQDDMVNVKAADVSVFMSWPIPGMTVMALPTADGVDGSYLTDRLAGKDPVTEGPALAALVDEANTAATMWFAMAPPSDQNPLAGMQVEPPTAVVGAIDLAAGFDLSVRARYPNPDVPTQQSQQLATILSQIGMADPVMGKVAQATKVAVEGNDLVLTVALDEATFGEVIELVLQQLGPMMGGGAAGPGAGPGFGDGTGN